jgi:hypothetical protein
VTSSEDSASLSSESTTSLSQLPEEVCVGSGGAVVEETCCLAAGDFSVHCHETGACGCSPESSHTVKQCRCPEGQCFSASGCVVE